MDKLEPTQPPSPVLSALQASRRYSQSARFTDAIATLQKCLSECESQGGASYLKVVKELVKLCNDAAGQDAQAPKFLKLAENTLQKAASMGEFASEEGLTRLRLLTLNNWANFHKSKRNYHIALNFLMRAGQLVEAIGKDADPDTLEYCAKTRLNTSALYSDIRRYKEAVKYAELCLSTLQHQLNLRLNGRQLLALSASERAKFDTMIVTYVVAFYNIALAEEALGHSQKALTAYRNAVKIGSKFLPSDTKELALARKALSGFPMTIQSQPASPQLKSSDHAPFLTPISPFASTSPSPSENLPIQAHFVTGELTSRPKSGNEERKYYTPERLAALHEKLKRDGKTDFVSADKFFYAKISSTLNVEQDVKHMRPLSAYSSLRVDVGRALIKDEKEKRVFSELRLRRHPNRAPDSEIHGRERIEKHITRLEAEFESKRKVDEVKRISRAKSRAYRSASQQNKGGQYPPQRTLHAGLFFHPDIPLRKSGDVSGTDLRQSPSLHLLPSASFFPSPKEMPKASHKEIKEEIEEQMVKLSTNLKATSVEPRRKLVRRTNSVQSFDCEFAASVRKLSEKKTERTKKSIIAITADTIKQLVNVVDRKTTAKPKPAQPRTSSVYETFFVNKKVPL